MTNRAGEDGTVATGVVRTVAAEAGCDEVLPRSAFSVRLAEILQRGDPAIGGSSPPTVPSGVTP